MPEHLQGTPTTFEKDGKRLRLCCWASCGVFQVCERMATEEQCTDRQERTIEEYKRYIFIYLMWRKRPTSGEVKVENHTMTA